MTIDKSQVAARFDKASHSYLQHAILQKTVTERLLARLQLINIQPKVIIDAGSGPGTAAKQLSKRYRQATIIQTDISLAMLAQAKNQAPKFFSKQRFLCADIEQLPLATATAELVFSSLVLQWCNDLDTVFSQIKTVLNKQGLFLFATLGPDTLKELRSSWGTVDSDEHVNAFIDMHDIGDALVRTGFVEPVMDLEHITMTYQDCTSLMRDLKMLGANNANSKRAKGLTGKNKMQQMQQAYETFRHAGRLPATYEIVYGHAWVPVQETVPTSATSGNEVFFPIASLKIKK